MSDLISRQAAIKALEELVRAREKWSSDARGEIQGIAVSICAIVDVPRAKRADNWIPVEEALPKHSGRYLATIRPNCPRDSDYTDVRYYGKPLGSKRRRAWYFFDSSCGDVVDDNVIAWQPLPEPYKGGER